MRKFKPLVQYDFSTGGVKPTEPTPRPKRKKTPTNSLTAQIVHYIELRGGYAMRINVSGFYKEGIGYTKGGATLGVPDIIAVFEGMYIGIEVKTGADRQSNEQKTVEEQVKQAKGVYMIARDFESFKADFEAVVNRF